MPGKVTVWYMTEEERLAYIEKYPINRVEKPKGVNYSFDAEVMALKRKRENKPSLMDKFDTEEIRQLFLEGEKLIDIAEHIGVSPSTLSIFVKKQKFHNPEEWSFIKTRKVKG